MSRVEPSDPPLENTARAGGALVFLNPGAGGGAPETLRDSLAAAFDSVGRAWSLVELDEASAQPEALRATIEAALQGGTTLFVAGGGDGTVSAVADALICCGKQDGAVSLAILPLGTANVLARELRIPTDAQDAVLLMASGHRRTEIDAMEMGGRHYLTQIGIGPDAMMIEETSHESSRPLGRLSYLLAFLRRAGGHRAQTFRISIDGRVVDLSGWQLVLANARTLGMPPLVWGPDIDAGDGVLNLCVYDVRSPRDYWRTLWRSITRKRRPLARFYEVRQSVAVSTSRPMLVQADGDLVGKTPIEVRVVPRALGILVPTVTPGVEPALVPRRRYLRRLALALRWDDHVGALVRSDAALLLWIHRLPRRPWLDRVMTFASDTMPHGEGWLVVLGAGMLIDWSEGWRAARVIVPSIWLAALTVNYPIKALFRRGRPFAGGHGPMTVVGDRPTDPSFPSGHSAAAFAGAFLLSRAHPEAAPLFYAVAVVVGWSRVYLGMHFPFDVVGGAVAGTLLGALYAEVLRRAFGG